MLSIYLMSKTIHANLSLAAMMFVLVVLLFTLSYNRTTNVGKVSDYGTTSSVQSKDHNTPAPVPTRAELPPKQRVESFESSGSMATYARPVCLDTDGENLFEASSAVFSDSSGYSFSYSDYCVPKNPSIVREALCQGITPYYATLACPDGLSCEEGKCVE